MVKIKKDRTEEITNWYTDHRDGYDGVVVETDDGYFEYWFPIKDAPSYIDADKVLGTFSKMTITEAPGQENESRHTGRSGLIIPEKVAKKAEEVTGYEIPD